MKVFKILSIKLNINLNLMSKNNSYSKNNISLTQEYNAFPSFNVSKTHKMEDKKSSKIMSLNSTPNTLNNKNYHSLYCSSIYNTFSNEREKERKKKSIPMSLSGKSSKKYFSISQGYPNLSKSFNKKYRINKKNKTYINYLETKNNKYIGIDLNLVSNSSRRKTENNEKFLRDKIKIKIINSNKGENLVSPKKNKTDIKENKDEYYIYENENEEKKDNDKISNQENIKKFELNSSTPSHLKQNSHLENASVNQSTPVISFHAYEADSSPTNYIRSYSNINNMTFLTNNNGKKNKNNEDDEKKSISQFFLNQSEFTYSNNSNKKSEKEEEKKVMEKINMKSKNKNYKKKKRKDNYFNVEDININDFYFNNKENEKNCFQNTIEEKEEEYLNSINNKLKISKGKETLEELMKNSEEQDTIYQPKKQEENNNEMEKEEIKLIKELEEEKEKSKKEEERIRYLNKEKEENDLKIEKIKEIKNLIKKEQIYRKNLEKKAELLEMKLKNEEIKNIYGDENDVNRNIELKNTNFMNNVNQVTFNVPKSTINAKLNFNYFSGTINDIEKEDKRVFVSPINYNNSEKEKSVLKKENSNSSYFYDYGSNSIINSGIFNGISINANKKDNNKLERHNFTVQKSYNKIFQKNNPEKQFQIEIKPKEINKNKNNENIFTSFNFELINNNNNSNNKKTITKESFINNNINLMKENNDQNYQISFCNKNTLEYQKETKDKTITKDASTQYYQNILDKNNKNSSLLKNYITSTGKDNHLKAEFKTEFLNKTKNILFDFEEFKSNYKIINKEKSNRSILNINNIPRIEAKKKINMINKIPHHNKIGRNKDKIWNEYSINNCNNSKFGTTEESFGLYTINKNKFNRKPNSFVFPANPFDSVNKAREYFFFND